MYKNLRRSLLFAGTSYLVVFFIFLLGTYSDNHFAIVMLYSYMAIIQLSFFLINYKKLNGSINHPYVYFCIAAWVCWLGRIIVTGLYLPSTREDIFLSYPDFNLLNSSILIEILSISSLLAIGLYRKTPPFLISTEKLPKRNKIILNNALIMSGVVVLVTLIPYIIFHINRIQLSYTNSYYDLWNDENIRSQVYGMNSFVLLAKGTFAPFLIMFYTLSYKKERGLHAVSSLLLLACIIIPVIEGARMEPLAIILALLFLHLHVFKRSKMLFHKKIITIVSVFVVAIAFVAVTQVRNQQERDLSTLLESSQQVLSQIQYLPGDTLAQYGVNIYSLYLVQQVVPENIPFKYGLEYIDTLSINLIGIEHLDDPFLNEYFRLGYGPGYSITAEAYVNFGYFAPIFIGILGLVYYSFFTLNRLRKNNALIRAAACAMFMYVCAVSVRSSVEITYIRIIPIIAFLLVLYLLDRRHIGLLSFEGGKKNES